MKQWLAVMLFSLTLTASPALLAGSDKTEDDREPVILGFVEWIVLDNPSLRLKARLDTGASTASLHATDVEEFKRDGERWVRFDLPLDDHKQSDDVDIKGASLTFERPIERTVRVKNKGAAPQRRHVVLMDFCIDGQFHSAEFSLTDRGGFNYPALLGRRFMADRILVDSADPYLAKGECDYSPIEEVVEDSAQHESDAS